MALAEPASHSAGPSSFSLIDRYIFKQTARPFALTLAAVLLGLLLERVRRLFDMLAQTGGPVQTVAELTANLVPHYLGLALPAAFFLSVFFVMARLNDDSELDALLSSGVSITRLSRPFFVTGCAFGLLALLLFGFVQPHSRYAYRSLMHTASNQEWDVRAQPDTFVHIKDGLVLTADYVDWTGRHLEGVLLRQVIPAGERVTTAAVGEIGLSQDRKRLLLKLDNGVVVEDRAQGVPRVVVFDELTTNVSFALDDEPFRPRGGSEREMTFLELRAALDSPNPPVAPARIESELHARIARSLSIPLLPLLAIPLAMAAKRRRRTAGLIISAVALVTLHHVLQFGESLGDTGRLPPAVAVWVPFLLFAAFFLWLFLSSRQRPGDNPISRTVLRLEWLLERAGRLAARWRHGRQERRA